MSAIPDISGPAGMVIGAGLNGARNVINFATWDAVKTSSVVKTTA